MKIVNSQKSKVNSRNVRQETTPFPPFIKGELFSGPGRVTCLVAVVAFLMLFATGAFADWTLPVSISSGTAKTNLTIGVSSGATNGYDQGFDSPIPFEGESLNAYFPHADWGVVVAGTPVDKFHRDIRGGIPQDFYFEILSTVTPVTIKWETVGMPEKTTFMLYDHTNGIWIDMRENVTHTFNPSVNPNGFTIRVTWGDLTPPSSPSGLKVEGKTSSLFITWNSNTESDLAGYKIHFGKKSGTYERTVDIKDVNNYSLLNLSPDSVYYIALTAYDEAGNESPYSMEVSGKPAKPIVTLSVSKAGTGSGTVTSSPAGISCGTDCSEPYATGTTVTLTATADLGSAFARWSGNADCSDGKITMNDSKTCTATFNIRTYTISGKIVACDGSPISGLTLTLSGAASGTATTDANGYYKFARLSNGNYTVTPKMAGFTFTPASRDVTIAGANRGGINFTGVGSGYLCLKGRVLTCDGSPVEGVTVTLAGASSGAATTDANGYYKFARLSNGSYTVAPEKMGYIFTPTQRNATLSNANVIGQGFTGATNGYLCITGKVTLADGTTPVGGVTINLIGGTTGTATTNANGYYKVARFSNGSYTLTPVQSGYTFTPVRRNLTLSGANRGGQNFKRN